MIVAVVALAVALGGTAVAGVATISKLSRSEKKAVRKIAAAAADRRITQRAPGLSVGAAKSADLAASARIAATATDAAHATSADQAVNADHAISSDHAGNADHATNAGTANGIRPVKVAFSAAAGSTTLLAEGGITISASCDGLGRTEVHFQPTPGGGLLDVLRTTGTESTTATQSFNQATFASGFGIGTAGPVVFMLTITYLGTSGTTVTGNLMVAQGSGIAQCAVGGTLLVG